MRKRGATGERRRPTTRSPTAYSYYKSVATVTETFSMGEEKSLDVQFEGVQAGVDFVRTKVTYYNRSTSIVMWESAGFRNE
jgi:hypothetical protein